MPTCLIPARGGSRRIPHKNLRPFAGKPMITWSIAAAFNASCFDRVFVSTDDPDIADAAHRAGARTPIERPAALADDHATVLEVMRHLACALAAPPFHLSNDEPLCLLYATAPLVSPDDLLAGLAALETADFALSVTTFPFPIQRALELSSDDALAPLHPEHLFTRSQDLEERWHDAGQFLWGRLGAWRDLARPFDGRVVPVVLPPWRVVDIDTPDDWTRAESLFYYLNERRTPPPGPDRQ